MHNVNNGLDTTMSSQSLMTYVLFAESDRNERVKTKKGRSVKEKRKDQRGKLKMYIWIVGIYKESIKGLAEGLYLGYNM
jgi:hypothetical protein